MPSQEPVTPGQIKSDYFREYEPSLPFQPVDVRSLLLRNSAGHYSLGPGHAAANVCEGAFGIQPDRLIEVGYGSVCLSLVPVCISSSDVGEG